MKNVLIGLLFLTCIGFTSCDHTKDHRYKVSGIEYRGYDNHFYMGSPYPPRYRYQLTLQKNGYEEVMDMKFRRKLDNIQVGDSICIDYADKNVIKIIHD